jgi:hypothetical protein
MFAYDKKGTVFAMCEGSELLVHDGPNEGPLWRETLDAPIVALGADDTKICAITQSGMVAWFATRTNERLQTASFDTQIQRAVVDMKARRIVAVTTNSIVELTVGTEPKQLADHGALAIAMRSDGSVLVATATNELVTLGPDGARAVKTLPAGDSVCALAWHPTGWWAVGLGAKVYRWDGGDAELVHITSLPKGSVLDALACCDRALAIAWDRNTVVSMAWPSKDTLGSLSYLERKVEGIDFGPWPWLGIALDLGDGNKHNLDRPEALHRSDTHPGRQHHSWLVEVGGVSGGAKKAPTAAPPAKKSSSPLIALAVIAILAAVLFGMLR